jgi:hypothetical protein
MRTLTSLVFLCMLFSSIPVRATVPDELCPAGQDPCIVNTTRGRDVVTNDVVRANAGTSANAIGQITLAGCNVTVNTADSVASIEVKKPSEKDQGSLAVLRQALTQRLGAFTLPLPAGEQCAKRVDVEVTAGKKDGKLSLKVSNALGDRDTDSIKLKCAAAP